MQLGSMFITNCNITLHVSDAFCVHPQEHLKTVVAASGHVRWVPVTTAWRVVRLRMEERPPIWRVAANKLNKQSRTADEGWSSSWGVGRSANNASP